jgi:hypothetical protein
MSTFRVCVIPLPALAVLGRERRGLAVFQSGQAVLSIEEDERPVHGLWNEVAELDGDGARDAIEVVCDELSAWERELANDALEWVLSDRRHAFTDGDARPGRPEFRRRSRRVGWSSRAP